MPTERILITVRTYPNLSEKYQETVCTGGINDKGEWRRLYPVQWRMLDEDKQYRQYDVIEVGVGENVSDGRAESRRIDTSTIRIVDHLDNWISRTDWVKPTIVRSMTEMINEQRTLAPVEVQSVLDFLAIPDDSEWSGKQKAMLKQDGLFGGPDPLEKIPYDFRLVWRDGDGEEHNSKFIDWEVCQTWRRYSRKYDNPVERMIDVWMNDRFCSGRSIYFFMGNFAKHRQNFGVCGAFYPPEEQFNEPSLW